MGLASCTWCGAARGRRRGGSGRRRRRRRPRGRRATSDTRPCAGAKYLSAQRASSAPWLWVSTMTGACGAPRRWAARATYSAATWISPVERNGRVTSQTRYPAPRSPGAHIGEYARAGVSPVPGTRSTVPRCARPLQRTARSSWCRGTEYGGSGPSWAAPPQPDAPVTTTAAATRHRTFRRTEWMCATQRVRDQTAHHVVDDIAAPSPPRVAP